MEHLVIKPTLACTAKCPTCAYRRQLYRQVRNQKELSFEDWKRVLSEARDLGAWHLTISGGEPTLYKQLPDLIKIGRRYAWRVRLNSNGSIRDEVYAEELVRAGLDVVDISLYSPIPAVHDAMRGTEGLWQKATAAISLFGGLRKKYPGFNVITQTILCRENYRDFAELLTLHYDLGSSGILISYLEGDFEKKHLFETQEINYFTNNVLPKAISICEKLDPYVRKAAVCRVKQIFSEEVLEMTQWANGVYRPERGICTIPQKQALILANGDVHPCNIVEYAHEPVMGNLFEQSLTDIWQSVTWKNFRQHLHEYCKLCPMNHHVFIPLRAENKWIGIAKLWMQRLYLNRVEEFVYPKVKEYKMKILGQIRKNSIY